MAADEKITNTLKLAAFALAMYPELSAEFEKQRAEAAKSKSLFDQLKPAPVPAPKQTALKLAVQEPLYTHRHIFAMVKKFLNEKNIKEFTVEAFCTWAEKVAGYNKDTFRSRIEYCKQIGLLKYTGKRGKNSMGRNVEVLAVAV